MAVAGDTDPLDVDGSNRAALEGNNGVALGDEGQAPSSGGSA